MAVIRNRNVKARNISQKIWLSSVDAQAVKDRGGEVPVAVWLGYLALGQPPQPRPKPRHRVTQDAKVVATLSRYRFAAFRVPNGLRFSCGAVTGEARWPTWTTQ